MNSWCISRENYKRYNTNQDCKVYSRLSQWLLQIFHNQGYQQGRYDTVTMENTVLYCMKLS